MTIAYMSTMGQNVRHIMSKYNVTNLELLYMPLCAINHKCKYIWHIIGNAAYYDHTNMFCKLVVKKDYNDDAVLNKGECNAVILYLSTIFLSNCCFF